jgi:hypothetical protein
MKLRSAIIFYLFANLVIVCMCACGPDASTSGCGADCPASDAESDACKHVFGNANPNAIVCADAWPDGNCKPLGHDASCFPGGPVFCCGDNDASSCVPSPKGCLPTFNGRCAQVFGDEFGSVQLCNPGSGMPTCKSLTNYSPGTAVDCGAGPQEVWCCP